MRIPASMMCHCLRCGHDWVKRIPGRPALCANCKDPNWDVPPGTLPLGRPPKKVKEKK